MSTGIRTNNPIVVSSFHTALIHQGVIVLLLLAAAGFALNALRTLHARRAADPSWENVAMRTAGRTPEPVARQLLRISFGLLWILDGVLQGQSAMPLGMVPQAIQPTASASPTWVQHLVNAGSTVWSYHPVQAAAAAVWIQVGIGLWLLLVKRGAWSRAGGLVSLGWGLVVWVFGESFGGIFAPGLTWLFGAPGAVLFYCVAGALIALPRNAWSTDRPGRTVLRVMGAFLLGMAVLQAWPGRGFWTGQTGRSVGTLTGMVLQMSQTPQPKVLASWVSAFEAFDAAHGWGVNLFVVVALTALGLAFMSTRRRLVQYGLVALVVLGVADWVLVEDFGFFGGVGTDPNNMIPMALVCVAGYLAMSRLPATPNPDVIPITPTKVEPASFIRSLIARPDYAFRSVAAVTAMSIVLVGGIPMAVAAASPNGDPILATAVDGQPTSVHFAAPAFDLTDQHGRRVSLFSLRGKTIALTFLDPVCTSDCPIIAQEFRQADEMLGGASAHVEMVAINANPQYTSRQALAAFDAQEHLADLPNWLYLTGSEPQLRKTWNAYGFLVGYASGGAMIIHSDTAYVIDASGHMRDVLDSDPGAATAATKSSFAVTLADTVERTVSGP